MSLKKLIVDYVIVNKLKESYEMIEFSKFEKW